MPENNVFEIAGLSMDRKMALYSKGIRTFDQITDFSDLSSPQRIQITSELRKEVIINKRISRFYLLKNIIPALEIRLYRLLESRNSLVLKAKRAIASQKNTQPPI